jgi:error-prone DNA polymerase
MATYVELQVISHFSFLRGASAPEELFTAAATLGHTALGLADHNTVAGIVRGWAGQKETGVRMIAGSRIDLADGRAMLLYPTDRPACHALRACFRWARAAAARASASLHGMT